jgi:hypothetical protein
VPGGRRRTMTRRLTKLNLGDRVRLAVFAYDSGIVRPRPS